MENEAKKTSAHEELKAVLGKATDKLARSAFAVDVAALLFTGRSSTDVARYLEIKGFKISSFTVGEFRRKFLVKLSEDSKRELVRIGQTINLDLGPAPEATSQKEPTLVETLRISLQTVQSRMDAIKKESEKEGATLTDKQEDRLMKYIDLFTKLRKELEEARTRSEVAEIRRRTIVDMVKIAAPLMSDEPAKRKLLQKVREYESADF